MSCRLLTLYILSIAAFVGLQYVLSTFVLVAALGDQFDIGVVFWESSLPYLLTLMYGVPVIPHVLISYILLRFTTFRMIWGVGTLFIVSFIQALGAILTGLLFRKHFQLNLVDPHFHDIVAYFCFLFIGPFMTFWVGIVFVIILEVYPITIFEGLLLWMTLSSFSFVLLGPVFVQALVLLELFLKRFDFIRPLIPLREIQRSLKVFSTNVYGKTALLILTFIFFPFLLWISSIRFVYYVLILVVGAVVVFYGFPFCVYWFFTLFVSIVFVGAVFDYIQASPLSLTFLLAANSFLVLFGSIVSDDIQELKRKYEEDLEQQVAVQTLKLKDSQERLQNVLDKQRQLLGGLTHEFNSLLNQSFTSLTLMTSSSNTSTILLLSDHIQQLIRVVDDSIYQAKLWDPLQAAQIVQVATIYEPLEAACNDLGDQKSIYEMVVENPSLEIDTCVLDILKTTKIFQLLLRSFSRVADRVIIYENSYRQQDTFLSSFTFKPKTKTKDFDEDIFDDDVLDLVHKLCAVLDCHVVVQAVSEFGITISFNFPISNPIEYSTLVTQIHSKFSSFMLCSSCLCTSGHLRRLLHLLLDQELVFNPQSLPKDVLIFIDGINQIDDGDQISSLMSNSQPSQIIFIGKTLKRNTIAHPITPPKLFSFLSSFVESSTRDSSEVPSVLIVDDSKMNVKLLQTMVKKYNIASDSALDGAQAIEMFKQRIQQKKPAYALVLMDILMPNVDGIDATKAIRALEHQVLRKSVTTIIAVSAHAESNEVILERMRDAGFDYSVKKPLSSTRLKLFLLQSGVL
ncbi:hypothetical protein GEMRC1_010449 [Eukaryota sp. GEM-RC1]